MPTFPDEPISKVRKRLIDGMNSYMQGDPDDPTADFDCGYTDSDVSRCARIVDGYLETMAKNAPADDEEIRLAVMKAVQDLNQLNNDCAGGLIETDQREDLCQIILVAARQAGLETDEDITEEWRQW